MCYAVTLESVLQGHENWIYSIHWQPAIISGETENIIIPLNIAMNLQ